MPPPFQGGMGSDGVQALDQFVKDGGTLVCMNGSSNFAIAQLKLPVKNVAAGRAPGSSSSPADRFCRSRPIPRIR